VRADQREFVVSGEGIECTVHGEYDTDVLLESIDVDFGAGGGGGCVHVAGLCRVILWYPCAP
jgi:hypothetical protein